MASTTRDGRVRIQYQTVSSASSTATATRPATTSHTRRLSSATRRVGDATSFGVVVTEVVVAPRSRFAVVVAGPDDPSPGVDVVVRTCRRATGPASAAGDASVPLNTTPQRTTASTAEQRVHLVRTPSLPVSPPVVAKAKS